MKKFKKVIFVCIIIALSIYSCAYFKIGPLAIYRTRKFVPIGKTRSFENWKITTLVFAYEQSWGADFRNNHDFYISVSASTYEKSIYSARIKSFRVLDKDEKEIIIDNYKSGTHKDGLTTYLANKNGTYIPYRIKRIFIITEVEFADKNGNTTTKRYKIPLKRKESQFVFLKMI